MRVTDQESVPMEGILKRKFLRKNVCNNFVTARYEFQNGRKFGQETGLIDHSDYIFYALCSSELILLTSPVFFLNYHNNKSSSSGSPLVNISDRFLARYDSVQTFVL